MKMKEKSRPAKTDADDSAKRLEIVRAYKGLVDSGQYLPTRAAMKGMGFSRDTIRHYFSNMSGLRLATKERYPRSFKGNIDVEDYVSDEYLAELNRDLKKYKRFVITTAVSGQRLHAGFIASIRTYCRLNKARLVILPAHDPAHNQDNEIEWHFDPKLLDDKFVFEDTRLNSNLHISGIRVTAKQMNPITSLEDISQEEGSFIAASPKQALEYDSVSANKLPHARMTTGACTLPNYKTSKGNSLRTAFIASHQHTVGAVIVEVEDNELYFFTQIQADDNGSFCHFGYEYGPRGAHILTGKDAPVLVMGDYHAGEHDESAVGAWTDVINSLGVQEVVFHDMFNGVSVNPHEEEDMMLRSERARKGLNVLENELVIASEQIDRILGLKSVKKGIMVKSNHDDMIDRYLRKVKYRKDPMNFEFCTVLSADLMSASRRGIKKDFFKTGLEITRNPKHADKILWLTTEDDHLVGGVHVGAHGDKAANGARGSIKAMKKSYPRGVIGHSHTPGIYKNMFQVGTTSLLRLGYNKGASSWVHCSCLVYRNGQRQLINSINGNWRLKVRAA
jgi:hypothetical protein